MKRLCLLLLIISQAFICLSQEATEGRCLDKNSVDLIEIWEDADSPTVALRLSMDSAYVADYDSYNMDHQFYEDKTVIPKSIAKQLFRSAFKYFVTKEAPMITQQDSMHKEDNIPYDLIKIPLVNEKELLLVTTKKLKSDECVRYTNSYIQFINSIKNISNDYRKHIISHAGEIDPTDPILHVSFNIDDVSTTLPFYGVILHCSFLNMNRYTYRIVLHQKKSIIQDWRKKFYYKYLPNQLVAWLYKQIHHKVTLNETMVDTSFRSHSTGFVADSSIYTTLPLRIDIDENKSENGVELYITLNGDDISFPADFIETLRRICKQYHDTCHK